MKKHEETSQKKSVKFQERTEIYYFPPQHPVSKETRSTSGTGFVSGGSDKPSISTQRAEGIISSASNSRTYIEKVGI
jgi:hypothetical protein